LMLLLHAARFSILFCHTAVKQKPSKNLTRTKQTHPLELQLSKARTTYIVQWL
jgi:hypothetical protein